MGRHGAAPARLAAVATAALLATRARAARLRLQLTLQFSETVTGLAPGQSAFTFYGFIPWAVYVHGPFFVGGGPFIALRSYGEPEPDAGVFTGTGLTFPVAPGFSMGSRCSCR